jgi:hypothetical protein
MIEIVPMVMVDGIWPKVQKGFAEACRKGGEQFSEAWLHVTCRRGDAYLCLMHEDNDIYTAMVLQEQQWQDRQVLYVLATTGHDRKDWWKDVIDWATVTFPGCKNFVFEGRPGWGKMPGVRVLRHCYEMDMDHGL